MKKIINYINGDIDLFYMWSISVGISLASIGYLIGVKIVS